MANAVAPVVIVLMGSVLSAPSPQEAVTAFGANLALAWLVNLGVVIYVRRCRPTIAITSGKWAEVDEHGDVYKCPPWQARFVVTRPEPPIGGDDQIGPIFPYIELKYGSRSLTVHSSSRYDADELEDFAERMNHFLWAGPTQPHALPILDTIGAGATALTALDKLAVEKDNRFITLFSGLFVTAIWVASASYGDSNADKCREAKEDAMTTRVPLMRQPSSITLEPTASPAVPSDLGPRPLSDSPFQE